MEKYPAEYRISKSNTEMEKYMIALLISIFLVRYSIFKNAGINTDTAHHAAIQNTMINGDCKKERKEDHEK
jgi:hypothetical protein